MDAERLVRIYSEDERCRRIAEGLDRSGVRIGLTEPVGASAALVGGAVALQRDATHLFAFPTKEEAAYFFNDLDNLPFPDLNVWFLPPSFRTRADSEQQEEGNAQHRTEVLDQIRRREGPKAVVTYGEAIAEKVVQREALGKNTYEVFRGEKYSIDFLNELLIEHGFEKVDHVHRPGQFSVRGGILDVFSYSDEHPYRIEFFGEEVDSIRSFNPVDQLSIEKHDKAIIIPNTAEEFGDGDRVGLLEFLGEEAVVWAMEFQTLIGAVGETYESARNAIEEQDEEADRTAPEKLFITGKEFQEALQGHALVDMAGKKMEDPDLRVNMGCKPQPAVNKNFDILSKKLQENAEEGLSNLITAVNSKQVERFQRIFEDRGETVPVDVITLELSEGFIDPVAGLACFTDHQIFERYHRYHLREGFRKKQERITLKELNELEPGDYVVHIDHGIGQFDGLERVEVNGKEQEAVRLSYKDNDVLYVSIHALHRISRYTGKEGKQPSVHKLGSGAWKKLKSRTKKKVKEVAFDLINLYAKRKATKGFVFSPDSYLQNELEASFIYEDTPDQSKATQAVKEDMEKEMPMDRLVCGDVGFGKTEVAIRAAFKAVADNKQVAILAPTTILSLQHYKSFRERLKDFPCSVGILNRFRSAAEQRETKEKMKEGKLDIVIGTHKLLNKNIEFKDLGLLVVDEEQKFGVSSKEKLKTLKANVDTLTLTATPIPRTLQFSLMGARDLSIINTPPPNRYPIHTHHQAFNTDAIRVAIEHELSRGGQVFFIHDRIKNINEVYNLVKKFAPEAKVAIGHGQMKGDQLENVMMDFVEGRYDVLVCTTIIENGIDIPNANTMIINDAQNFGLSDLHQLRGRVGRSNKKAYCYLLTPPVQNLTEDARKRLKAIEQFSELGSGFNIAMRDLDIRGAGDLLGAEQSGFINEIGYEMYQKVLNEAITELKQNEFKELFEAEQAEGDVQYVDHCQIETDLEVLIPGDYVNNTNERLSLYQHLDNITDEEELKKFEAELIDRFGPVPEPAKDLFNVIRIRWMARDMGFQKLVMKSGKMLGYFIADQDSPYFQSDRFATVLEYVKNHPRQCEMKERKGKPIITFDAVESVSEAYEILSDMQGMLWYKGVEEEGTG